MVDAGLMLTAFISPFRVEMGLASKDASDEALADLREHGLLAG